MKQSRSGGLSRLQTELDDLPTVLRRDPFLVPPEVARYVKLNDLRHPCPLARLVCSLRVTLRFPAALTTDRIANRTFRKSALQTAHERIHMPFPLTCWTRRRRFLCHLIVKTVCARLHFSFFDSGGYSEITSIALACRIVNLKGMSLHRPDHLSVIAIFQHLGQFAG